MLWEPFTKLLKKKEHDKNGLIILDATHVYVLVLLFPYMWILTGSGCLSFDCALYHPGNIFLSFLLNKCDILVTSHFGSWKNLWLLF